MLGLQPTDLVAELVDRLDLHSSRQRELHRQLVHTMRADLRGAVERLSGEIVRIAEAVAAIHPPAAAAPSATADTVPVSSSIL